MRRFLLKLALGSLLVMASVVVAAAQEAPARASVANLPNPATIDRSGGEPSKPANAPDIRMRTAAAIGT
jgi:hypothetical protein